MKGTSENWTHGTNNSYTNGCRCPLCTEVHREHWRELAKAKREAGSQPPSET